MLRLLHAVCFLSSLFLADVPAYALKNPVDGPGPVPKIRYAISELQDAKDALEQALHDFGGHRVNAVSDLDQALDELNRALAYAKQHPEQFKQDPAN